MRFTRRKFNRKFRGGKKKTIRKKRAGERSFLDRGGFSTEYRNVIGDIAGHPTTSLAVKEKLARIRRVDWGELKPDEFKALRQKQKNLRMELKKKKKLEETLAAIKAQKQQENNPNIPIGGRRKSKRKGGVTKEKELKWAKKANEMMAIDDAETRKAMINSWCMDMDNIQSPLCKMNREGGRRKSKRKKRGRGTVGDRNCPDVNGKPQSWDAVAKKCLPVETAIEEEYERYDDTTGEWSGGGKRKTRRKRGGIQVGITGQVKASPGMDCNKSIVGSECIKGFICQPPSKTPGKYGTCQPGKSMAGKWGLGGRKSKRKKSKRKKRRKKKTKKRRRRTRQKGGMGQYNCVYPSNVGEIFTGIKLNKNPVLPDPINTNGNTRTVQKLKQKGGGFLDNIGLGDGLLAWYKGTNAISNVPIRYKGGKTLMKADPMHQPGLLHEDPVHKTANVPKFYTQASDKAVDPKFTIKQ